MLRKTKKSIEMHISFQCSKNNCNKFIINNCLSSYKVVILTGTVKSFTVYNHQGKLSDHLNSKYSIKINYYIFKRSQ